MTALALCCDFASMGKLICETKMRERSDIVYSAWMVDFYYPLGSIYREVYVLIQHIRNNRLIALSLTNRHNYPLITCWQPFIQASLQAILHTYAQELARRRGVIIDSPMSIDHRYLLLIYQHEHIVLSDAFYPRRYVWLKEEKSWYLSVAHQDISWNNPPTNYKHHETRC